MNFILAIVPKASPTIKRQNTLDLGIWTEFFEIMTLEKCLFHWFLITFRYVELASNERTDYKARELKSVHVEAEGTFLKFVLHKNFVNKLNMYNQVIWSFKLLNLSNQIFFTKRYIIYLLYQGRTCCIERYRFRSRRRCKS